jgi:stage III sporulation protein SpoIIIAA
MLLNRQILNPSGDEDILDLFNAAGRLMLVLGEPGSGKTTLLLDLTRSLLAQAEAYQPTNSSGIKPLDLV